MKLAKDSKEEIWRQACIDETKRLERQMAILFLLNLILMLTGFIVLK